MKKANYRCFTCVMIPFVFVACFTKINEPTDEVSQLSLYNQYVKSGTIEIGFDLPTDIDSNISTLNQHDNIDLYDEENPTKNLVEARFSCVNSPQISSSASNELSFLDPTAPRNQRESRDTEKNNLHFAPLIGFFPLSIQFKPADNEVWIQILKDKNQIEVYKGQEVIRVINAEGKMLLAPGEYPLQHKQRNPLWYAPDEYFSRRELRVPPRGDHFRYRRGALGNYALYPTMDFVIHSGPFWSEEVGGLKVSEADLSSIFVMLNVGAPIIIK